MFTDPIVWLVVYVVVGTLWIIYCNRETTVHKGWHLFVSFTVMLPATLTYVALAAMYEAMASFIEWLGREV